MTELTPEVIQAEIENLESITPAQDYHIVLLPLQDPKTSTGILKSEKMLQEERTKAGVTGYAPIVKANPNIPEVKTGWGVAPITREVRGATREQGVSMKAPWVEFTATEPVTPGVVYMTLRNSDSHAFQTNN